MDNYQLFRKCELDICLALRNTLALACHYVSDSRFFNIDKSRLQNLRIRSQKQPFGVYLGWICVATIANVTALLVGSDWHGGFMSEANWTFIMIAIGGAIGAFAITQLNNSFIAAAILWAFLGIYIKRSAALEQYPIITIGILLGGAFVLVGVFHSLKKQKAKRVDFDISIYEMWLG